jgi:general secretion pathway protein L
MARQVLGIDITDERLVAVQVELQGKSMQVRELASLALPSPKDLVTKVELLLRHFTDFKGTVVCGLPLSAFCIRNLSFPFRDKKRLAQILPFEMAEQLVQGIEQYVTAHVLAERGSEGAKLLVFSLPKASVGDVLDAFATSTVDPEAVTISAVNFSQQLLRFKGHPAEQVHIHADLHWLTLVASKAGQLVFARRLPYSERMFTHSPFQQDNGTVQVRDHEEALTCLRQSCQAVERALDFFRTQFNETLHPEQLVLTGPLATEPMVVEAFQRFLPFEVSTCNLLQESGCQIVASAQQRYIPGSYDRAFALALVGVQRKLPLDFRLAEFTKKRSFLVANRSLSVGVAAAGVLLLLGLGYLIVDKHRMQAQYDSLHQQMVQIYQQAFPGTTRVDEPLKLMQSKMIEQQAPEVTLPIFTQDKRVLSLMTNISAQIPSSISVKISRLVIDQDGVSIKGTTDAYNNVDAIKGLLSSSDKYGEVQIVSASADKDKDLVRFELKLDLLETS